ncbi:Metacaspase-7 [Exaiptasia diaphana]|nr:Metacaspase-7 [Exaiptasia diaphana]
MMDVLQKRALLIKPSYNEANRLNGTENDVQNVKKVLTGKFDFKETAIKVLKDDQATKKNILKELSELTESCESHSVVLVYYTGHGTYLEDSQDEGLCPTVSQCQTEPEEPKEERCITGQDLSPFFEALSKKSVYCTVIFDCCYSGHLYRDKEEEGVKIKQLRTKPSATASKHKKYTKADRGGWIPGDKDNFFYFAACTSDELAKEKKEGGYLTLAIADTLDKLQYLDQVTYEAFYRLLRKEFREKNWHNVQTPQFEAGNFKTVLFGTSQVEQAEGGVEISEVISTEEFVLSSGSVQGLRSGCYLVYKATASEQSIKKGSSSPDYLGTIAVKESQIQSTHAIGSSDRPQPKITCGCLAYLQAAARVKRSVYFSPAPLDMTIKEPLILELNKSDMFTVVAYPPTVTVNDPDPIGITCETIKR